MTFNIVMSSVAGFVWMLITSHLSLESWLIGFVVGLAGVTVVSPYRAELHWRRLPGQLTALVIYLLILARDIILSGLDVARRVLSPTMPLTLGIIEVDTQDEQQSPLIAALSADVITLTPGELVVHVEDNHLLYVHCLDVITSTDLGNQRQAQRVKLFKRIIGRPT